MTKLLNHPKALCHVVRRIALEAGEITLKYFDESGFDGAQAKGDGSPVTIADKEAEKYITEKLIETLPDIPVIGEEAVAEGRAPDVEGTDYFWLVDALDGTKEFISGGSEYTVNIALIHNYEPILGVVYAPVSGELYAAHGKGTAIKYNDDTETEKAIKTRDVPKEGLVVVSSKSHGSQDDLDTYLQEYKVQKILKRGSSLKICAIAAGKADLYPRFGPTCLWDTAAGHAVLRGAGGDLLSLKDDGSSLTYDPQVLNFLNPDFVAKSKDMLCML